MKRPALSPAALVQKLDTALADAVQWTAGLLNQRQLPNPATPSVLVAAIVPIGPGHFRSRFQFTGMGPLGLQLIASGILAQALHAWSQPETADPVLARRVQQALALLGDEPLPPAGGRKLN